MVIFIIFVVSFCYIINEWQIQLQKSFLVFGKAGELVPTLLNENVVES